MSQGELKNLSLYLKELDKAIESLKVLYEQYFMGLERFEPAAQRKKLKVEIRRLKENPPKNTAVKFLLNKLETKFRTYEQYWNRILRQIEDGVYEKQIKRMKRKIRDEGLPDELLDGVKTKGELEAALATLAELRKSKEENDQKEPTKQKSKSDKPKIDPSIYNAYQSFVRARLKTGESLEGITPQRFQAALAKQIPAFKKAKQCKEVEIKITVKDGKATLQLSPKYD